MTNETLHSLQLAIAALAGASTALLGFMFWNASLSNRDRFTTKFLQLLSVGAVLKAAEIACAVYRTSRIAHEAIPQDASVAGLIGRGAEVVGYAILIWFLLRPETKRALNGGQVV